MLDARTRLLAIAGGLGAAVLPQNAWSQEKKPFRVALFTYAEQRELMDLIKKQFAQRGLLEGKDIVFEERAGKRSYEDTKTYAKELGSSGYDLVIAMMTTAGVEMRKATTESKTPVVFWSADPVESGIVDSFAKFGGNLTGVTVSIDGQLLQLRFLKEAMPGLKTVGMLYNPDYGPAPAQLRQLQDAGRLMEIAVRIYEVRSLPEIEPAFKQMMADGLKACVIGPHELFNVNGNKIGAMALANRLAAVSFTESLVRGGAVACFAPDFQRVWPAAVDMAIRILRGENVGAIPVNRKLQLKNVVNAKALKELGLTLPTAIIEEADEIIS
jgi:putative ABC transport system substrate-binding protein